MTEKVELKVEKNESTEESKKINPEVIEKLKEAIEKKEVELEGKKYLIPGGKEVATLIKNFICEDAKWKFTEALGIIEVNKIIQEFLTSGKKDFMIPPVALEATYYFLSKHEGKGLAEAETCTSLLKAINQAKARADEDKKEYEEMQFRLQSLEHGIDPDAPQEELVNETNK